MSKEKQLTRVVPNPVFVESFRGRYLWHCHGKCDGE